MRTEHLEYLLEIAKRRSMNAASEKLHVAQQTLSTAVKILEKEFDTKLLERTYQGVYPTPIGQELIELADDFLAKIEDLKLKIAATKDNSIAGSIVIGIDHGINILLMPKVVSQFYKYYPNVRLSIVEMSRENIHDALLDHTIDIGLIPHYGHLTPNLEDSPLVYVEILTFTFYARVSRYSPLAQESILSLRTLLNYPLALYNTGTSSGLDMLNDMAQYGKPQILPTHQPNVAQQLVSDNLAVSISVKINNYTPMLFNTFNDSIVTIPLKEQIPFHTSYCMLKERLGDTIIDNFIEILTKMT